MSARNLVINRCSDCTWYQEERIHARGDWHIFCDHPQFGSGGREMDVPNPPPPDWCPLPKADEVKS